MIGGIEETSASFEARSAPRSYPTEPHRPRVMRGCPRGQQRSVDRGARRPAIEPRKYPRAGRRRRTADGRQYGWARYREAQTARRGRRHWHAWTLLAREPGDLTTDRSAASRYHLAAIAEAFPNIVAQRSRSS